MSDISELIKLGTKRVGTMLSMLQEKQLREYLTRVLNSTTPLPQISMVAADISIIIDLMSKHRDISLVYDADMNNTHTLAIGVRMEEFQNMASIVGSENAVNQVQSLLINNAVDDIGKKIEDSFQSTIVYSNLPLLYNITMMAEHTMAPKLTGIFKYEIR